MSEIDVDIDCGLAKVKMPRRPRYPLNPFKILSYLLHGLPNNDVWWLDPDEARELRDKLSQWLSENADDEEAAGEEGT